MVNSNEIRVLKTKEGKIVTVRRSEGKLKPCAVDVQNNQEPLVCIDGNVRNRMTLQFMHENHKYFLKVDVDGNSLLLEKAVESTSDRHLFMKDNSVVAGNYYRLQSVVEPSKFLAIERSQTMQHNLVLSKQWVLVTDEKVSIKN